MIMIDSNQQNIKIKSLIEMEDYLNQNGKSLSDFFALDNEEFDKDVLLAEIIRKGATFEPLYVHPDHFYDECKYWWLMYKRTFKKWFDVFDIHYDPLENYNKLEEITEHTIDNGNSNTSSYSDISGSAQNTSTVNVQNTQVVDEEASDTTVTSDREVVDEDGTSNNRVTGTSSTEAKVSAFDSTSYQPHDKTDTTSDTTESGSTTMDRTTTKTGSSESSIDRDMTTTDNGSTQSNENQTTSSTENGTVENETNNEKNFTHTNLTKGNIGVTTSQQMLESELSIQAWNEYRHIADIFCHDMCVRVYGC